MSERNRRMHETKKEPVTPIRVQLYCCSCKQEMSCIGYDGTKGFFHECMKCRSIIYKNKQYPYIEYEKAK